MSITNFVKQTENVYLIANNRNFSKKVYPEQNDIVLQFNTLVNNYYFSSIECKKIYFFNFNGNNNCHWNWKTNVYESIKKDKGKKFFVFVTIKPSFSPFNDDEYFVIDSYPTYTSSDKIPSAGFIAFHMLEKLGSFKTFFCGFSFKGWHGHDWSYEKRYIMEHGSEVIL